MNPLGGGVAPAYDMITIPCPPAPPLRYAPAYPPARAGSSQVQGTNDLPPPISCTGIASIPQAIVTPAMIPAVTRAG